MNYCVYILFSVKLGKYYIGQTEALSERLTLHNNKEFPHSSTKAGVPWIVFFNIECQSRKQAVKIEVHIKRMKSSKYVESLKSYPEIVEKLKKLYEE